MRTNFPGTLLLSAAVLAAAVSCGGVVVTAKNNTPKPIPTAVIGEKPVGPKMGSLAVTKLPKNLSSKQTELLGFAYAVGKTIGLKHPEIVQAVVLQETLAGGLKSYRVANPGPQAYFGPMQIKLAAAKDVLNAHPHLYSKYEFHTKTDDEIKANLILNEKFNIEVGAYYLKFLHDNYQFTGRTLINAYNRGPSGVKKVDDNYHYAIGAEQKVAQLKNVRADF